MDRLYTFLLELGNNILLIITFILIYLIKCIFNKSFKTIYKLIFYQNWWNLAMTKYIIYVYSHTHAF